MAGTNTAGDRRQSLSVSSRRQDFDLYLPFLLVAHKSSLRNMQAPRPIDLAVLQVTL